MSGTILRYLCTSITYFFIQYFCNVLCTQQTGTITYEQLGLSFEIPQGWVGQESGSVYVMGSMEVPGLIVLIPHDRPYSIQEMKSEAAQGMDLGGGTVLRPAAVIESKDNDMVMGRFDGTLEYNPVHSFVIGKVNPFGNGVTVLAATTPDMYQEDRYKNLALEVAKSILFSEITASSPAGTSNGGRIEDWKYQLSGTRLTFMESYNSGGADGGGYNMSTEIHLCQEGFFRYYDQSFMSAGGLGRTAVSSHQAKGHGTWDIITTDQTQLVLLFHDGTKKYFNLEWREDTKLFMNGYRYFRTWEGEYAPDCSY